MELPNGAGEGSCGVELRWRAAGGDMTRLRVEEYGRRYLLKMVSAAVVPDCVGSRECVVARLVEQEQV